MKILWTLSLSISLSLAFAAEAQTPENKPPERPADKQPPAVLKVENANGKDGGKARLKHRILVDVDLDGWLIKPEDLNTVILFLDYRPLTRVKAAVTGPAIKSVRRLAFDLTPDYQNDGENWRAVLISSRRSADGAIPLSVGLAGKEPIVSSVRLQLSITNRYDWLAYVGIVLVAIAMVLLARKTNLLRDTPPIPVAGGKKPTYSLARVQMAIWFLLVLAGWCYISLLTDSAAQVSDRILMLIGISGTTGLAAVAVDSNKWTSAIEERRTRLAERDGIIKRLDGEPAQPGLRQQVADGRVAVAAVRAQGGGGGPVVPQPAPVPSNLAEMEQELQTKEARLAALQGEMQNDSTLTANASQGWLIDVLSDDGGVSMHRLQIFVWTIALGIYFLIAVFRDLLFPELDNQLLILMGISSGTYLGFKLPEKPTV